VVGIAAAGACYTPAIPTPGVVPQSGQTFQRDGSAGGVVIRLPCDDPLTWAAARWDDEPWVLVDSDTSDGRIEGVLPGVPVGRHRIQVQTFSGLVHEAHDVGVGDVFPLLGQSNMMMQGIQIRASLSGGYVLPVQVAGGAPSLFEPAIDSLWFPACTSWCGSAWPLVADLVTTATGIPVGFVALAEGGTGLVAPADWAPGGGLWARAVQNVRVATGSTMQVRAVLWHQGEADAINGVEASAYRQALCAFAASLASELSGAPLVAGVIGRFPFAPEAQLAAIRQAQQDAAQSCPAVRAGPWTEDLPVNQWGHFGDAAIPELAARWCEALTPLYAAEGHTLACR
jgi:hypothetical protein